MNNSIEDASLANWPCLVSACLLFNGMRERARERETDRMTEGQQRDRQEDSRQTDIFRQRQTDRRRDEMS